MRNPYLQHAGGGWIPAPGAFFGASRGSGVYTPAPQAFFGQAGAMVPPQNHYMTADCPPHAAPIDPCKMQELASMLRHPHGQWPNMPPLGDGALQAAAACVVCGAQQHADDLSIVYGVDSGAVLIAVGATATITVTPQKRHIPEKLVLSEAIAGSFLINGIFAGVEPVLATTGAISAAIFVQDSTAGQFKSVIMDVGMDFSVQVTNISGAPARFTTTVVGKPIPPGLG